MSHVPNTQHIVEYSKEVVDFNEIYTAQNTGDNSFGWLAYE